MRPCRRFPARNQRGSAVVDFVLVSLILVPLVMGIVQLGLVLHVRNTLTSAAAEGARLAGTIDREPADGVARTRQQIDGALSGRFAQGVTARRMTMDGVPVIEVQVDAAIPPLGLWGPAIHLSVQAHGVEEQP